MALDIVEVGDSILDIPVQDPPVEEFSSSDLNWSEVRIAEDHIDNVALIPYTRVDAFIIGECSNVECPTRFHIERGRKRPKGSLKEYKEDEYLEYRLYWCSFGPENYGEGGGVLPSRRYRLNTRNRAARPQSMRGCTCHFVVKRLYAQPSLALIIYNERRHVNKSGSVCHGPLDRDAIGPGAKKIPYICSEIQQQTMSMLYLGIPEESILQSHIEGVQRYCGSNAKADSLATQYVKKLEMIIKRSTHELDLDDQSSIRLWVERNKKSVFFYQDSSDTDSFILGIQTDWQLQQMVRFGHHSLLSADSMFGVNKLKYPLYSLLVFDSRQQVLPIAWIITRSSTKQDTHKWIKALCDRVRIADSSWRTSGFLIDDAAAEIDPIREAFSCPILFCSWRIRRKWLRNIIKRCSSVEIQREIFKRLGKILYSIFDGVDFSIAIGELMHDFADETVFTQYFEECWVPKIEMWLSTMRTYSLASQEASSAIEGYHLKLKKKIYDDSYLGSLQRVDWLVHKLSTEIHSSYWLNRYADESGSFSEIKDDYISSSSWNQALLIPDNCVILDDADKLFAKVLDQEDSSSSHMIWNPGSEFSLCDCNWSMQGNLCKHLIKVNMVCHGRERHAKSLSFQSFQTLLTNLGQKPMDGSMGLDKSIAWTNLILEKIQRLVELSNAEDIGNVVNKLPLKWHSKKGRTSVGKPAGGSLALPSTCPKSNNSTVKKRKNRKRKRLSTWLKTLPS